jgi:hypothetical protein
MMSALPKAALHTAFHPFATLAVAAVFDPLRTFVSRALEIMIVVVFVPADAKRGRSRLERGYRS